MGFEVVDFVQTTRRWYDRGDPRDAGELYACQVFPLLFFQQEGAASCSPFIFYPTLSRRNSRNSFSRA